MKKQKLLDWISENTKTIMVGESSRQVIFRDKLLKFIDEQSEYRGII